MNASIFKIPLKSKYKKLIMENKSFIDIGDIIFKVNGSTFANGKKYAIVKRIGYLNKYMPNTLSYEIEDGTVISKGVYSFEMRLNAIIELKNQYGERNEQFAFMGLFILYITNNNFLSEHIYIHKNDIDLFFNSFQEVT